MTKLLAPMAPVACFIVAGYMAVQGIDGWGWFLFVGVLVSGVI